MARGRISSPTTTATRASGSRYVISYAIAYALPAIAYARPTRGPVLKERVPRYQDVKEGYGVLNYVNGERCA